MSASGDNPLETVCTLLRGLPTEDLQEVQARVKLLLNTSETPYDEEGELFWETLRKICKNQHLCTLVPHGVYRKHIAYPYYHTGFKNVKGWTHNHFKKATYHQRRKVYKLYVGLLLDYFERRKLIISAWTIGYNVDKIPALVNNAFPGYADAGLLHKVLEKI